MLSDTVLAVTIVIFLLHSTKYSCSASCKVGSNIVSVRYSDTIVNHTLVGPVMSNITAKNERECEMECHLAVPDKCSMFNYHPSSKVCELLYKDRAAEYKVEKKKGSTFKTRKCASNPCVNGQCYSLGENTSSSCTCDPLFEGSTCEMCKQTIYPKKIYLDAITNYTIVGPLQKSLTARDEEHCKCECQWHGQGSCNMFNYYPSSKVCELFHGDSSAEYKVEKNNGSTFRTQKCVASPCLNAGTCVPLGEQSMNNSTWCLCETMFNGSLCQNPICNFTSRVSPYTNAMLNYSIVGSILWSFTATNETACQCACDEKDQGLCHSFNFNPLTRLCELFYKDTTGNYSVVKNQGTFFKAQKCDSNPCLNEGKCYTLGDQTNKLCLCHPLFTGPICATPICKTDPNVSAITYIDAVANYTITGPVLRSLRTINQMACECTCQMTAQGSCYMFNFNSSSKLCELFYKDRSAEYTVVPQAGMTFKTQTCKSNPCYTTGGQCYSLGDDNSQICLCAANFSGKYCHVFATGIKVNTNPVCIGAKNNAFGTFVAPCNGKVKTFRLIHLSGGVSHGGDTDTRGTWGAKAFTYIGYHPSKIELHVTYPNKTRITPPVGYPLLMDWDRMGWETTGYNYNSPDLLFPEITPITVTKGQTFNIWYGQDYMDSTEGDNHGTTCANVYMVYTE